jgi:hypothetical protein
MNVASKEVVRPGDITALKDDLVKAVTNAYMAKRVPELYGLTYDKGECDDGEFRYKSPSADNVLGFSLESDVGYYCSYPGGVWKEDVSFLPDIDHSDGDGIHGTGHLFDAAGVYAMVESEVSSWLDPFGDCHSPNEFANQINSVANVASQLYVGNEIVFGGQDVSPVGGDGAGTTSAVSDVRSAIDEVKLNTDDMRGLAIDAFQRTYVLDVERCIGGQRGLATAAGLAITAEAMAWNETYISMRDFVKKAIHDFNDYAGSHGGSGEGTAATLGAVSAISGLAGATVGIAFPPFGAAMGVVGGVATVGGLMFPATAAVAAAPLALSGGSYMEYWTSFKDGIKDINTDLRTAEEAIAEGCHRMLGDYHSYPDNYSITRGAKRGKQGPEDDATPFLTSQIDFNHTKMKLIAGAVESIGDHQRTLAGRLGGVDGAGSPSSQVAGEWSRGSLPEVGTMGSGYSGPYAAYSQVVEQLTDLLLLEAKTAHRLAEHCIDVSLDFKATDGQREASLDQISKQFDTVPVPVVNGPVHP